MTAVRAVEIVCNYCYSSITMVDTVHIAGARRNVARQGWRRRGDKDFCSAKHESAWVNLNELEEEAS